jgi:hypothetical protein
VQHLIDAVATTHRELAAALQAKDVELVADLAARRGDQLRDLQAAWRDAGETERQRRRTVLQDLLEVERELVRRCEQLRDEYGARLAAGSRRPPAEAVASGSGRFDRQA